MSTEFDFMRDKARIIQESVPGRQLTIAHVIANPDHSLYEAVSPGIARGALGILNITPGETVIIAADIAIKSTGVSAVVLDRTTGALVISGTVSEVETALRTIAEYAEQKLGFSVCEVTKT